MKALITATIAAIALASPAAAWEFDSSHQRLENTIEHLMEVTVDHPDCAIGGYAGWISSGGIVACSANSENFADFQDTLRHEGVHLAQRCKAYLAGQPGYLPLDYGNVYTGYQVFGGIVGQYPESQQDMEAEAWYVASLNSPAIVDRMIRTHCSFAF